MLRWDDLHAAEVGTRLGLGDAFSPWLEEMESLSPPTVPARLPDAHNVSNLFARLNVEPSDAADILDAWPTPEQTPEGWWLLQRCHQQLIVQMGEPYSSPRLAWLPLPSHLGAFGRLFYMYVFLATLPAIRQWHHERGIADDVSWATLADLGEHIAIHRRIFGEASLAPDWLTLHFGGKIYRLGRLQFERWRLSPRWPIYSDGVSDTIPMLKPSPGALALSVHIPESGGALDPVACDESFARAREFFSHHFPEEPYNFARCSSWLLDPQFAAYLPPTSNIVRFQRRFQLIPGGFDDEIVIKFVFRRIAPSLDELPQRTTLERAIVKHLRDGKRWQVRSGWLVL